MSLYLCHRFANFFYCVIDLQCPECFGGYCIEIKETQLEKETVPTVFGTGDNSKTSVKQTLGSNSDVSNTVPGPSGTHIMDPDMIHNSSSKNSLGMYGFIIVNNIY